jgi:hypothetical protein
MNLIDWEGANGISRHRDLPQELSLEAVRSALPGITDRGASGDGKVTHQFRFLADGVACSIWRWKGIFWSSFGPRDVFVKLGLLPSGR